MDKDRFIIKIYQLAHSRYELNTSTIPTQIVIPDAATTMNSHVGDYAPHETIMVHVFMDIVLILLIDNITTIRLLMSSIVYRRHKPDISKVLLNCQKIGRASLLLQTYLR